MTHALCSCTDRKRPCEYCLWLLRSDAFSGVDARNDFDYEGPERSPFEDAYEFYMEGPR